MKVILVAHTFLLWSEGSEVPGYVEHDYENKATDPDELAEIAGRLCYESWTRPNPKTATNKGYLGNIINQRHFSVLEHASATFYLAGVSRSFLAEVSRHRHFSLSVVSQRYVDHGSNSRRMDAVQPEIFDRYLEAQLQEHYERSQEEYDAAVEKLMSQGYSRKEARGAARSFLPEATETAMLLTGNMRAFREMIEKRNSEAADIEIRNVAKAVLVELKKIAPNAFQDME